MIKLTSAFVPLIIDELDELWDSSPLGSLNANLLVADLGFSNSLGDLMLAAQRDALERENFI